MRNKNKLEIVIIVLGIVFVLSPVNHYNIGYVQENSNVQYETDLKPPSGSGYWSVNFIHVDGNWSETATVYDWCSGDGSWRNPYTIENITIDASTSATGSGILIENSKNDYFIIRNCTVYNAGIQYKAGIKFENAINGTLIDNNCFNNWNGIYLNYRCNNNTLLGNSVNNNLVFGIDLNDSCNYNTISGNIANNNGDGILLYNQCNENTISGNTATNNYHGIYLSDNCDHNNIINGNVINGNQRGIMLEDYCDNNNIMGNDLSDNVQRGILLEDWSTNNIISGNTMNNHIWDGILLYYYCDYNTIVNNTGKGNGWSGIYLTVYCDNNTISGNTVNKNTDHGVYIDRYCNDNTISRNNASDNDKSGIYLSEDCDNNIINANLIENNQNYGMQIINTNCENNLVYLNSFIGNGHHARDIGNNQWDNGTIGNYWDNYTGVDADDDGIGDTPYDLRPPGGSVDNYPIWDDGLHVITINSPNSGDFFGTTAPSFNVSINFPILDTSWYTLDNGLTNYIFIGTSGTISQAAWVACAEGPISIKFFVNNTAGDFGYAEIIVYKDILVPIIEINLPTNNMNFDELAPIYDISVEEGNLVKTWYTMDDGITNITFTELTGIINQDLWDLLPNGHVTIRFYARDVADHIGHRDVIVIKDVPYYPLYVEISNHFFSIDEFNITFFIFDENYQGIAFATIQMWWNGLDVSDSIQNLGSGLYFVSLEPITVAPGEDPIRLSMIISAEGYEDKHFETYLAVDPETLGKGIPAEEFPLTIIIVAISSIAGGIGVAGVSIFLLRRRKRESESK